MEGDDAKHDCNKCGRKLSSKQRLMTHLKAKHDIDEKKEGKWGMYQRGNNPKERKAEVPIKKYKKYKDDPTIPVPRMTQYRKKIKASRANGEQNADQMLGPSNRTLDDNPTLRDAQDDFISDENDLHVDHGDAEDDLFSSEDEPHVMEHSEEQLLPTSIQSSESEEAEFGVDPSIRTSNILTCDAQDGFLAQSSTHPILSSSIRKPNILTCVDHRDAEDNLFSSKDEHFVMKGSKEQLLVMSIQSSESEESIENDEMSGLSEFSESSSESSYASSDSDSKDTDDTSTLEQPADSMPVLTECEEKYMTFLAYSSRHCLNTEAVNDLINLFAVHNPQETDIKNASFSKMKSAIGDIKAKIYDFCIKCHSLFPEDENITECGVPNCKGLRFKGTKTQQALKQRKSYFACTAIEQQIKDILERRGMWKSVKDYRKKCEDDQGIKDIHNGEMYQSLREPGQFLANENNISLMFNTDGVPLYNSSKVSIWPVYLVINELPPMHRFSRQNMILWGVWQAKGKPTFQTFFRPFIQDMISLKMDGFALDIEGSTVNCKAILLAGTLDLQAKAMVMEMTHHNGEFGCLTCEMPGTVVAQGKGHARVFPFSNEPFATRTSNDVLECGLEAQGKPKPVKGIKGVSVLHGMEWFDTVNGLVPDYMHGILLGVTKKMLVLILSSSNSPKTFFVGKDIKNIDKFLMDMKPTDLVTRLPRKLEEHLHNLKASEIQIWLLYYCIPCLIDFQKREYLDNLALLVEGVYIALGDCISNAQLDRANYVLKTFYRQFEELYGANNVTLNIHNAGEHLISYVRKLGPAWAWSCFPFEDMNGSLLEQVHGTGNVCLQILWTLQAHKRLAVDSDYMSNVPYKLYVRKMIKVGRQVQAKKETSNCKIAGSMKLFDVSDDLKLKIQELLSVAQLGKLYKILRIIKNDQIFFSADYSRVEKRVSHVVFLQDVEMEMASVQYYVYHEDTDQCLAVLKEIIQDGDDPLVHPTVHHLKHINPQFDENELTVVNVDKIKGKLLYLNGNDKYPCVSKMPNPYGQCS